jgi:hypothetical protein
MNQIMAEILIRTTTSNKSYFEFFQPQRKADRDRRENHRSSGLDHLIYGKVSVIKIIILPIFPILKKKSGWEGWEG